ncbi:MAG: DUF389 domain-containing protein [Flavobacteriaceae bacterium]|jgi:uncharacterized hydrophobic protein (TIGR00271 family)|nr:DUF389 domain-containing protein [Flavobacteriaceae bacterium]
MENKFNFSDEDINSESLNSSISNNAKGLLYSLISFFKGVLDFRKEADKDHTINSIKNDISIKGPNAWILICSILVASVGLNANSIPVVIGAMLISPLMGPILGFGLSIAINDLETLKKSLINFSVMVFLSVFTAYLFFSFFPLREESSELLSRTKPDIRDVLIAFFGGLSLIIAKTKKGTISPVIFGVAIATALMPPLCTVGYGLAVGKIQFAIGAMYLFIINSLYIVLSTFLIVKLLRFPLINYVNSSKRRLISRIVTIFSILMLIPAIYTFLGVLYESKFNNSLKEFYEFELDGIKNKDYLIMNSKVEYDIGENNYIPWQDKLSVITFNSYGLEPVSKDIIAFLKTRVKKYPQLSLTSIVFNQQEIENDFKEQKRFLVELRKIDSLEISSKTKQIEQLENKLKEFEKVESLNVLYKTIIQDIKFNYEDIEEINLQNVISLVNSNDFEPIFLIKWKDSMLSQEILVQENKIREWLSFKLESESFQLKRLN